MKNIYLMVLTLFMYQISIANPIALAVLDPTVPALSNIVVCDNNYDGFSVFDLTVQNAAILAAQSGAASDYSITYHENLTNAQTGANPLGSPYYNISPNSQTIYVRIKNVNTNAFVVGQFQIIVNPSPIAFGPPFYLLCDDDGNTSDGVAVVNLNQFASAILDGQNPSMYSVTYYTTQVNAENGVSPIIIATSYVASNNETVWVRVQNNATGCYALTTIQLHVEPRPNTIISTVNSVSTICVDFITGVVIRSLTLESGITNPDDYTFEWFEGSDPTVIGTSSTYTVSTASPQGAPRDYAVHVTNNFAGTLGCDTTSLFHIVIQSGPATPVFNTVGYEVINLSGVQSIVVDVIGFGIYEYSLDSGQIQTSNVFDNVSLGSHTITVFDTVGGLTYSCDPLVITNVLIETSQVPAPTGLNSQSFPAGSTLANITISGSNIQWYASPYSNATPLPLNTILVNGTTYYATQTVGGIQSAARLAVMVQVALGVSDIEILTLHYVPNPVKDVLNLTSNTILKSVLVCNLLGQKVIYQAVNDSNATVDFSFLPSGNYMVKVQGETAQKVIKIVKQ